MNKKIITFTIILSRKYSWQYEYNDYNDIIKKIYSYGKVEYNYEYDERKNIIKIISSSGKNCKYEYDHNNNLTKETLTDGSIKEHVFKYDSIGRLIQIENCYIEYK